VSVKSRVLAVIPGVCSLREGAAWQIRQQHHRELAVMLQRLETPTLFHR
jgi:hypothetical protein